MSATERSGRRCEVLLVEDNPADANLLRQSLASSSVDFHVHVVGDGDAALDYLEGPGADRRRPDLILLDLNLPGRDGREVLAEIRGLARWESVPILVLTSSQAPADVRTCSERRADGFFTKPIDLAGYDDIAEAIAAFWLARAP